LRKQHVICRSFHTQRHLRLHTGNAKLYPYSYYPRNFHTGCFCFDYRTPNAAATGAQRLKIRTPMSTKVKTLCELKKDCLKENLPEYKKLVRDARFLCKKCGRAARDAERLCKPVSLDS